MGSPLFSGREVRSILCFAQAVVDVACHISDHELHQLRLEKGTYQKVTSSRIQNLLSVGPSENKQITPGGSATNSVVLLGQCGIPCCLVTGVGNDVFGESFISSLSCAGVSVVNIAKPNFSTGTSTVFISTDGERTMCTYLGASEEFNPDCLQNISLEKYSVLLLEGYLLRDGFGKRNLEHIFTLLRRVKKFEGTAVLSLPPAQVIQLLGREEKSSFRFFDVLHGNREEFFSLFETSSFEELEDALSKYSLVAVITDGANGARAVINGESWQVPASKAEIVDLTGAGDAFLAGWLSGAFGNLSVEDSLRRGNLFAAKVIGKVGSRLTHSEVQELLVKG